MSAPHIEGDTVAIVAGGAGLLGRLVVERLRTTATHVIVLDVTGTAGGRPNVTELTVDLTDEHQLQDALSVVDDLGRVTVLVNAQGRSPKRSDGVAPSVEDISVEDFTTVLSDNLTSSFLTMREIVPRMASGGGGRVVNVGSTAAHTALTTANGGYAAAKAGVEVLTALFARQYGPAGVLVSCVAPGKFANPAWPGDPKQTAAYADEVPLGRIAEAREVADAIVFLGSEQNTYVTGTTLIVDGGRLA